MTRMTSQTTCDTCGKQKLNEEAYRWTSVDKGTGIRYDFCCEECLRKFVNNFMAKTEQMLNEERNETKI